LGWPASPPNETGGVQLNYVPKDGGNTFKLMQGFHDQYQEVNRSIAYTFRNQVPISLTQFAVPYRASVRLKNLGLSAQDQWTVRKLTLNLGVRFDYFNGYNLAQDVEARLYVDARHFDRVDNVLNWKDVSPRLGADYDLFGNGKTAVKGSIGRYVTSQVRPTRLSNRLIGHRDAPLCEEMFGVSETQTKALIEPDCVADDQRVTSVSVVAGGIAVHEPILPTTISGRQRRPWSSAEAALLACRPWSTAFPFRKMSTKPDQEPSRTEL
jgi:hypothetical protein